MKLKDIKKFVNNLTDADLDKELNVISPNNGVAVVLPSGN